MRKLSLTVTITGIAMLAILFACNTNTAANTAEVQISQDSLVRLGDYLVNAIGCDDCHTPKKMGAHGPELDLEYRFAGHLANRPLGKPDTSVLKTGWMLFSNDLTAMLGPWGISYAANISSDATGIGNWSEEQFMKALRHGKMKGLDESRPILPPMPWQNFAKLKDQDIKAIFAYLKSAKPVENRVPEWKKMNEL